jgi:hypothetical protein
MAVNLMKKRNMLSSRKKLEIETTVELRYSYQKIELET